MPSPAQINNTIATRKPGIFGTKPLQTVVSPKRFYGRTIARTWRIAAPLLPVERYLCGRVYERRGLGRGINLRIAVGIATVGRPALLHAVLDELMRQSRLPDRVVVCAPSDADVGGIKTGPALEIVVGPRGLTIQRNAILACLDDFDVVQFFDDDFLPATDYLAVAERAFAADPTIAMATGSVIADGIKGPGIDLDTARSIVAACATGAVDTTFELVEDAYGCNMAVRLAAARAMQCRFDERLPLYGWMED